MYKEKYETKVSFVVSFFLIEACNESEDHATLASPQRSGVWYE